MKKIVLMDYLGTCDERNIPIGHTVKVLNEYSEMLASDYEVWVATADSTQKKVKNPNKICVPYAINLGASQKSEKLKNIVKRLKNISLIFKQSEENPVWVCSSDFYIFLYLFLCPRKKNKLAITLYRRDFDGEKFKKIKNYIFKQAMKKVDLIVCSDQGRKEDRIPVFSMPDYLFQSEHYLEFQVEKKKDKVVCLGTMGKNKLLEEMVDAFNQNGYQLEIIGKFFDGSLFEKLREKAKDNIKIQNKYISDEEYLKILGTACYSILPYNMQMYKARTSGVILESIFLNTIPIANKELLDFMKIPGMAYENIEELATMDLQNKGKEYDYKEFVQQNYSYEKIRCDLLNCFQEIMK